MSAGGRTRADVVYRLVAYRTATESVHRVVADVAIEVGVARAEADRVGAEPCSGRGFVPAGVVPLQAGVFVEEAVGEGEQRLVGRARLRGDVAEGVVPDTNSSRISCIVTRRTSLEPAVPSPRRTFLIMYQSPTSSSCASSMRC